MEVVVAIFKKKKNYLSLANTRSIAVGTRLDANLTLVSFLTLGACLIALAADCEENFFSIALISAL